MSLRPHNAPQLPQSSLLALSLLRSYKGLTVGDQSYATSILPSSQSPGHLLRHHGLRLKRALSSTRRGRPRAQLVSSLLHHDTSAYLRRLPGHGAIRLYHQPVTPPRILHCSLRYLSLMAIFSNGDSYTPGIDAKF